MKVTTFREAHGTWPVGPAGEDIYPKAWLEGVTLFGDLGPGQHIVSIPFYCPVEGCGSIHIDLLYEERLSRC